MGVANSDAKLYDDEIQECIKRFPGQFRCDYALSREQNNRKGGKMYIQDKVEEYKDQIFQLLDGGAHMYFCGLKGMMPGILEMLEGVCKEKASTTTSGSRASGEGPVARRGVLSDRRKTTSRAIGSRIRLVSAGGRERRGEDFPRRRHRPDANRC